MLYPIFMSLVVHGPYSRECATLTRPVVFANFVRLSHEEFPTLGLLGFNLTAPLNMRCSELATAIRMGVRGKMRLQGAGHYRTAREHI